MKGSVWVVKENNSGKIHLVFESRTPDSAWMGGEVFLVWNLDKKCITHTNGDLEDFTRDLNVVGVVCR